jgi:nicotinate-nucleotide--dimethylbenzimidazole phosphoribosyltransferase
MKHFNIRPVASEIAGRLQAKIDQKTKPLGALGRLETLALQIGCIQQTLVPRLEKPTIVIFAGDHGITAEGVSAYPAMVTYQMVMNFLNGGAAINIFAQQHGIEIKIVDAGVNYDFVPHPHLINAKIAKGTQNFLLQPAMTLSECQQAITKGAEIVAQIQATGCNTIGFGEMGIGNTSSASVITHLLTNLSLIDCVDKGTGLTEAGVRHKQTVLAQAIANHNGNHSPLEILSTFGGFEIAMMVGAYYQAAELGMLILVDGLTATSALLVAAESYPTLLDYCIVTHRSQEKGHQFMLNYLRLQPLCNSLNLRLGEGSGIAVIFPLIQSAVEFLNQMASFDTAGVSKAL